MSKFRKLYEVYMIAQAKRTLASYDDSMDAAASDVTHDTCDQAVHDIMLTPASDLHALSYKLQVFRDEALDEGHYLEKAAIAVLADDARRLASRS